MGFRFQKRIKILPGVRVNLSKSGISTSLGVPGAQITKGHGKTRTTIGLPGTGLSHSEVTSAKPPQHQMHWALELATTIVKVIAIAAVGFIAIFAALTSTKKRR